MCGIAGFASLRISPDEARRAIGEMCQRIRHRGPDGGGTVVESDVALGMSRLAIVDVEHGHQPMATKDQSVALVYNGEIYNAPALRARLQQEGVSFLTRSDTEVILRLYERDPERVEQELVGMWAFAIHDRRRRRLVLSRDRFGIKPLYIADRGGAVAFASELGAFEPVRDRPGIAQLFGIDHGAAHAMLAWSYIPGEQTIYEGVKRIAPGTRLTIDLANGTRTTRRYWDLTPSPDAARVRSLEDACAIVEPLLRRAVSEHLESDVPVAAFLSGGIDSSLVLAHASAASSRPIQAFTIGFREPRFDESPFAREAATRMGVQLHVELLDEAAARDSLADALFAYDEPFGDSSSIATFLLSRVVAKTHKVALGGDGGDEVFAGYKKHRIVRAREVLARLPGARGLLAGALHALPGRTDRSSGWTELLRTAQRAARGLAPDDGRAYLALTQVGSLEKTARLVRRPALASRFEEPIVRLFHDTDGTELQKTLASDLANVLPNDMLTKVDRASMACHLEARVPLLDHRIVEVGFGLPAEYTLGDKGKRVLRTLHERHFGARLATRKKQGFGVPVEAWLRDHLEPACEYLFAKRRLERYGLLSSDALAEGRWRGCRSRDPQLLWHAFALAAWCEVNLGGNEGELREQLVARRSTAVAIGA